MHTKILITVQPADPDKQDTPYHAVLEADVLAITTKHLMIELESNVPATPNARLTLELEREHD